MTAEEPFCVGRLPFQLLRPVRPVTFRISARPLVQRGVPHIGPRLEEIGRGEAPLLVEGRFDPASRQGSGY